MGNANTLSVTPERIGKYNETLPNGVCNIGRPNVTVNFAFGRPENGKFTIYPIMWNTNQRNTVGIYYEVNGVLYTKDIYTIKTEINDKDVSDARLIGQDKSTSNSESLFSTQFLRYKPEPLKTFAAFTEEDWNIFRQNISQDYNLDASKGNNGIEFSVVTPSAPTNYRDAKFEKCTIYFDNSDEQKQFRRENIFPYLASAAPAGMGTTYLTLTELGFAYASYDPGKSISYDEYLTKGIEVTIPEGIEKFGMYLRKGSGEIFYSEAKYNDKYLIDYIGGPNGEKVDCGDIYNAPYAATFVLDNDDNSDNLGRLRRICFEDWTVDPNKYRAEDMDLNDVILYTEGLNDVQEDKDNWIPEDNQYQWIIAAEDLGGSYDWDFNDLVVGVSYIDSEDGEYTDVTITPLAAGGTLPLYLTYSGRIEGNQGEYIIGSEIHKWVTNNPAASYRTQINVDKGAMTHVNGRSVTFKAPAGFSLKNYKDQNGIKNGNMGGFGVLVDRNIEVSIAPDNKYTSDWIAPSGYMVNAPIADKANATPQIICVGLAWEWPIEGVGIHTVYYGFQDWVKNYNFSENPWYGLNTKFDINKTLTVKRPNKIESE